MAASRESIEGIDIEMERPTSSMKESIEATGEGTVSKFAFRVTYKIPTHSKDGELADRIILDDVYGCAHSGEIMAIMGASGSGKTSLLNVLAGRVPTGGKLEKCALYIDGKPRKHETFSRISAYVMQEDSLFPCLTVLETFTIAAQLRLPRDMSHDQKNGVRDATIREMGLTHVLHTQVGNAMRRGVSGGERKRINIGVEMMRFPSVLLLDEPTTSLDSAQALKVMETLQLVASHGRMVICAVHQPRSSIYQMFQTLVLLTEGGHQVFVGPASHAVAHFAEAGFSCPQNFNPADYFLDILSTDSRDAHAHAKSQKSISGLVEFFRRTCEYSHDGVRTGSPPLQCVDGPSGTCDGEHDTRTIIENGSGAPTEGTPRHASEGEQAQGADIQYGASWFVQVQYLMQRQAKETWRNLLPFKINLGQALVFATVLSLMYSSMRKELKSVPDRTGVLFFMIINTTFGGVFMVISTFPKEKAIIIRERNAKAYQVSAYMFSKYAADISQRFIPPLVYGGILYWSLGLNPKASSFFVFIAFLLLTRLVGESLGMAICAVTPSFEAAQALAPPTVIITLLFGGFYINQDNLPTYLSWLRYVSSFFWAFGAFLRNEFTGERYACSPQDASTCHLGYYSGDEHLKKLGFAEYTLIDCLVAMLLLHCAYLLVAFLALRFLSKPKYIPV